ncbi:hypothetical protein [Streptomyces sp. NPDC093225]|uniref:hypothetical protein n=1 Tax=Streptomyces sp. NPDC093225 TaxID=3366034 RepID=UPI0037FEDF74
MARIIRTLAVSGAAAAAILSAAPLAAADTPEQATAIVEAAVDRAAGAPVSLPSGRTVAVRGLDSVSYHADAAHHGAVVTLANSAGVGAPLEQTSTQLGTTTQVRTQAGTGAAIGTGVVVTLVLGIVLFFGIKHNKVSKGWAFLCAALGITLGGSVLGPLVMNLGDAAVTAVGSVLGSL